MNTMLIAVGVLITACAPKASEDGTTSTIGFVPKDIAGTLYPALRLATGSTFYHTKTGGFVTYSVTNVTMSLGGAPTTLYFASANCLGDIYADMGTGWMHQMAKFNYNGKTGVRVIGKTPNVDLVETVAASKVTSGGSCTNGSFGMWTYTFYAKVELITFDTTIPTTIAGPIEFVPVEL